MHRTTHAHARTHRWVHPRPFPAVEDACVARLRAPRGNDLPYCSIRFCARRALSLLGLRGVVYAGGAALALCRTHSGVLARATHGARRAAVPVSVGHAGWARLALLQIEVVTGLAARGAERAHRVSSVGARCCCDTARVTCRAQFAPAACADVIAVRAYFALSV